VISLHQGKLEHLGPDKTYRPTVQAFPPDQLDIYEYKIGNLRAQVRHQENPNSP
jgi:hypothetical protein